MESFEGGLHLLRVRWLAAEINGGLGDEKAACQSLEEVRREFANLKIPFDAALASLDLAEIFVKQGRWQEIREIAKDMLQLFKDLGVHRETVGALLLFRGAVEREEATVDLVRRLAQFLREAREDPSHHFEG